tara:strand:- start:1069 stop:2190 length:1122 start_codon:yes stop_codon:yes gene_type:complete
MKVAVFLTFNYSINTWNQTGTLLRELEIYKKLHIENGINFTFFSYGDSVDEQLISEFGFFEVVPIFKNINLNNKIFKIIFSLLVPIIYSKKLKQYNIIQQHQLLGSWVPLLVKLLYRKPVLIRTGYDMYEFSILNNNNFLRKYFLKVLTQLSLKYCDLYTVTSNSDINFLKANFSFNSEKVKLRPNWIIDNNSNFQNRISDEIISVGRLDEQKNYLNLVKLFTENQKYSLKIIGEGERKHDLMKKINKNNLKVSIEKNMNHENLLDTLKQYRYFISSSLFEGNPKTLLEAMSSGCIVFASKIKNHEEIIDDDINGVLFDLSDDSLISKFESLDNNNSKLIEISKNANKTVVDKYHIGKISKKVFSDYKLLISK